MEAVRNHASDRPAPAGFDPAGPEARPPRPWRPLDRLPDGPLDLIGDIHGELDAMEAVLGHLDYRPDGSHADGRRMVFLGDLIDRGPDSPGVVRRIAEFADRGRASTVLGNHDLNALAGLRKRENTWLFGHGPSPHEKPVASDRERDEILAFLGAQPLAMERDDLRVVHACWHAAALREVASAPGPAEAMANHRARIRERYAGEPDCTAVNLAHQNENPMKLITSGPEVRAPAPFFAGGKVRHEARHPWWETYDDAIPVVFGHYWRIPLSALQKDDGLLSCYPLHSMLGRGAAICIDYSVGGRAAERKLGRTTGPYTCRLAALRWPERELVFDDGDRMPVAPPPGAPRA